MTALKGKDVAAFAKKRDPRFSAILIYGPDGGSVRERSDNLATQVVADLQDPFNFIELTEGDLKHEPARLVDEAAALSFAGGERVVRVRGSTEAVTASAKLLLNALEAETFKPNALTIIEAGDLRKSAGLRKLFEGARKAAALPCYEDGAGDIRTMISDALAAEQLTITNDAMETLVASLGTDRGVSRSEINKLILFKGPKDVNGQETAISAGDVHACLTDAFQDATTEITRLTAAGQTRSLSVALNRASEAGTSPITILIFLQRQFTRLYTVQSAVAGGMAADAAMKKLRPPVFYGEQRAFQTQLGKWPVAKLERAISHLMETEHQAKQSGAPIQELIERLALRLATMAK